jgi:hypothetical protein
MRELWEVVVGVVSVAMLVVAGVAFGAAVVAIFAA